MVAIKASLHPVMRNFVSYTCVNINCVFPLRCIMALLITEWFSEILNGNSLRRRSESMYLAGTAGHV